MSRTTLVDRRQRNEKFSACLLDLLRDEFHLATEGVDGVVRTVGLDTQRDMLMLAMKTIQTARGAVLFSSTPATTLHNRDEPFTTSFGGVIINLDSKIATS